VRSRDDRPLFLEDAREVNDARELGPDARRGVARGGSPVTVAAGDIARAPRAAGRQGEDPPPFEALFKDHWSGVYATLVRLTGDREEAEDLALEVFLRLHRRPPLLGGARANLAGWLYRVATRLGLNALRDRRRRRHHQDEAQKRLQEESHSTSDPATELDADLFVIGPEAPLEAGLVNALSKRGILCMGPTKEAARIKGPVYIRLGRNPAAIITSEKDPFEIGKANLLKEGKDAAIFACGHMVHEALKAGETLEKQGVNARIINLHTPKPIDKASIVKAAKETGAIVTAEEHTIYGGFGSAICEVVAQTCPVPVKMVGIKDSFGESGEPPELFEHFGITAKDIVDEVKEAIKAKKG